MKKILSLILTLALVTGAVAFTAPGEAKAANNVKLEVTASPTELTGDGTVSLTASVVNNGSDITDAVLYYQGEVLYEFGNIKSGQVGEYTDDSFDVKADELGKDLEFVVQYQANGSTQMASDTIKIAKKAANVDIATDVKVDNDTISEGDKVVFTFTVENQGDVAITNARLKAPPLNNGDRIGDEFDLDPGKIQKITYSVEVSKDITVKPVLTFEADGKEQDKDFDSVSIKVIDATMDVMLSAASNTADADGNVDFTVTITNTGNTDFSNLKVYDPYNYRVPTDQTTLKAGDKMSVTKTLKVNSSGDIAFYVTAQNAINDKDVTFNSNTVNITVPEPSESASPSVSASEDIDLTIEATADTSQLATNKMVVFTITVANSGTTPVNNIVVSENTLGDIKTIDTLAGGEKTITYEYKFEGSAAQTFVFKATGQDTQGNDVSANSTEIKVDPNELPATGTSGLGTLMIIIIIIIVLIIGVGITLIVLVRKEKKNKVPPTTPKKPAERPISMPLHTGDTPESTAGNVGAVKTPKQGPPAPPPVSIKRTNAPQPQRRRPIKKRGEFDDRNNF